ncbi:hypothetical protein [Geobacter sp. DSM 9736]|uniref:hypothetical protein n=1 Tax=Geobacter sp. DSM 9736 TaxID=1277350 RepID=UPI000B4FE1A8|nr:hypothetical protein [Geobacter sp. DSM 9736]
MKDAKNSTAGARKYFIYTGIAVGTALSLWYLYRIHLQRIEPGVPVKYDPVWTQFVNIALIYFAAIFQFSLLHKLYGLVMRFVRKDRPR